jgi:hypothetical protein
MTQLDLMPVRVPEHGSQCWELLMAFQRGEKLTTFEAYMRYGITTISQRCGELRRRYGWNIRSETIEANGGAKVSRYWLEL